MLGVLLSQIGLLLMIAACLFAWLKGGPAERGGAAMVATAWIVGLALEAFIPKAAASAIPAVVDGSLAIGLLVVAIRYSSAWLGIAMLLQSIVLYLHAQHLAHSIGHHDYFLGLNVTGAAMLAAIVLGAVMSWRGRIKAARLGEPSPLPMSAADPLSA